MTEDGAKSISEALKKEIDLRRFFGGMVMVGTADKKIFVLVRTNRNHPDRPHHQSEMNKLQREAISNLRDLAAQVVTN